MVKLTFEDICKWLVDNGFRRVSVEGANKWIYMNDDYSLSVVVRQEESENLTVHEEELVKDRLKSLGYLFIC